MNAYTTHQLAAARREELLSDATYHRQHRPSGHQSKPRGARHGRLHRGRAALRTWIDASQL